jgi:imidazole glycerol-phosphate synthase subunit HisH
MITIIDYGAGNLTSISNMLKRIGEDSEITNEIEKIAAATKLILPGVVAERFLF